MNSGGWRSWLAALVVCANVVGAATAGDWPQWRGRRNDGICDETRVPVNWSAEKNVRWRVPLPGSAGSTPVVFGNQIFLTSAKGDALVLLSVSTSGKQLWERQVGSGDRPVRKDEGNMASPSPCTDGQHVWAFMGNGELACFTVAGEPVWQFSAGERYGKLNIAFGMTSTPVLDGEHLYLQLLHTDGALVVALDKTTGRELWKHQRASDARDECLHSYASPMLYRDGQQAFLLAHGCDYVTAHDLVDGHELWRCGGMNPAGKYNPTLRFVASPVAVPGLIVVPSAKNGPVLALRPDGRGDVTSQTGPRLWTRPQNTPDVPSPLVHDGLVYLCRENGVLICIDAQTGDELYQERVFSDRYRASPVFAAGNIYLTSRKGVVTVVRAGRTFEKVAQNELGEEMASSPAFAGGRLYLRTFEHLYCIADDAPTAAATSASPHRLTALTAAERAADPTIFNGRDLSGWVVEGAAEYDDAGTKKPVWTVADGLLHCAGRGYGFIRYDRPVADFVFSVEYRMAPKCNSGLGIRGTKYTGKSETRPSFAGYEIQLLDDRDKPVDDHSTGSLYRYLAAKSNPSKSAGEWNRIAVECRGPRIRITLNDELIQDVDQSQVEAIRNKPLSGYLSLQNHGGVVDFRNVQLRELSGTDTTSEPKP